jgi:hypothetical protein
VPVRELIREKPLPAEIVCLQHIPVRD